MNDFLLIEAADKATAAAHRLEEAALKASAAADRMESAAHRIAMMLEDGYGGNGLRLIELLSREKGEK